MTKQQSDQCCCPSRALYLYWALLQYKLQFQPIMVVLSAQCAQGYKMFTKYYKFFCIQIGGNSYNLSQKNSESLLQTVLLQMISWTMGVQWRFYYCKIKCVKFYISQKSASTKYLPDIGRYMTSAYKPTSDSFFCLAKIVSPPSELIY